MFLDVAAALCGQLKGTAMTMWKNKYVGSPSSCLDDLIRRGLVGVDTADGDGAVGDGVLVMHDVLRALGHHMLSQPWESSGQARNPRFGSRLWVKDGCIFPSPTPTAKHELMSFEGIWRQWGGLQPHEYIFWLGSLSQAQPLPRQSQQSPQRLMAAPGDRMWRDLSGQPLVKLDIERCSSINELPFRSLAEHAALASLQVCHCLNSTHLPAAIGDLTRLGNLCLADWPELQILPPTLGNLVSLRQLTICSCHSLKELPSTLGQLTNLQELSLFKCSRLKALPECVGSLASLQRLRVDDCPSLTGVPASLSCLTTLTSFQASEATFQVPEYLQLLGGTCVTERTITGAQHLPEALRDHSALQYLLIEHCPNLTALPDWLGELITLRSFELYDCPSLRDLPNELGSLPGLVRLELMTCHQLVSLPSTLGRLSLLRRLSLSGCDSLEHLPASLRSLSRLQELYLSCSGLVDLPDCFASMTALCALLCVGCAGLEQLPPSFGEMHWLRCLRLCGCNSLSERSLELLSSLVSFEYFELGSSTMECLPVALLALKGLNMLEVSSSPIKQLPTWTGGLSSLDALIIRCCDGITGLPASLDKLSSLTRLSLYACSSFGIIPDSISALQRLRDLNLSGSAVASLPDALSCLESLAALRLAAATCLQTLPAWIGQLSALQILDLSGCDKLTSLPAGLDALPALKLLELPQGWGLGMLSPQLRHKVEHGRIDVRMY